MRLIFLPNVSRVGGGVHSHQAIFSLLLLVSTLGAHSEICCQFSMRGKNLVIALTVTARGDRLGIAGGKVRLCQR